MSLGLNVPDVVRFQYLFEEKFHLKLGKTCLTIEELTEALKNVELRGVRT